MQRRGLVVQRGPWLETPRDAIRKGIPLAQIDQQYQYKQRYGVMDSPQTVTPESPATAPAEQPVTIINNYQSAPEEYAAPIAPETCLPGYTYSQSLGYCVRNINYYGCIPGVEFWDPVTQTCSRNWPVCGEGGINDLNTGACIYQPKPEAKPSPVASYEAFKAITDTTMTKEQYDAQVAAGNAPITASGTAISKPLSGELVTRPALLQYKDYKLSNFAAAYGAIGYYQYEQVAKFYVDKWLSDEAKKQSASNSFFSKNLLPTDSVVEEVSYPSIEGATLEQVQNAYHAIRSHHESNGTVTVDKNLLYDIGPNVVADSISTSIDKAGQAIDAFNKKSTTPNQIEDAIGSMGAAVDTFKNQKFSVEAGVKPLGKAIDKYVNPYQI
jgi:hypothetical protein